MSNSFVLRQKSFRDKETRKDQTLKKARSIGEHEWLFKREHLQYVCEDWQDQAVVVARLAEVGGQQGLEYAMRTSLSMGLLKDEVDAQVGQDWEDQYQERKGEYGINEFTKRDATPFCHLVWEQLQDPFLIILIIAAFINIIIGIFLMIECPQNTPEYIDGLAILLAVSIVVFVGAYQDYSQEAQFRAKEDESAEKLTFVSRSENPEEHGEGIELEINQKQVMVGDLVILKTGATVPADGIFIQGTEDFKVSEASMTGETLPLGKSHATPLVLGGTQIVAGEGVMLVVSVGDDTQWGQMMAGIQGEAEETPLQELLDYMAKMIGYGGMAAAFLLFVVLIVKWGIDTPTGEHAFTADMKIPQFLILAVTIIVVAVPEGLPLAVTISLSYSMKRMMTDNNFVRHLAACETMSNATTICSDKTGTLTLNEMNVDQASIGGRFFKEAREVREKDLSEEVFKRLTVGLCVNSKAFEMKFDENDPAAVEMRKEYGPKFTGGNATEYALLKWVTFNMGSDFKIERHKHITEKAYPFSSVVKASSILVKESEDSDEFLMYLKGAAEKVALMCDHILDPEAGVREKTDADQDQITADIDRMAKVGLRCVGMAWRSYREEDLGGRTDGGMPKLEIDEFNSFIWIAVAGIKDPVRKEVPQAVADAQRAGVIVRMVTGDHLDTAKYIAKDCGIYSSKKHVCMTGAEFRNLTDAEKEDKLPWLRVMARSQPQDKENLVRWYKAHNEIVAVTGDGANDALALKEANVGLAMGIQGTDVAKEAADIIIMDDNFKSIVASVTWGRCVYDNIRKFLQFQLTVNVVACVLSLIAAFMDTIQMDAVLTPIQLLWVNLIMDTMAALALGTERPNERLLERFPFRKEAGLISPVMKRFILGHSLYQLVWLFVWIFFGWQWFNFGDHVANLDNEAYYPSATTTDHFADSHSTDFSGHANYDAAACAYSSNPPKFFGQSAEPNYYQDPYDSPDGTVNYFKSISGLALASNGQALAGSDLSAASASSSVKVTYALADGSTREAEAKGFVEGSTTNVALIGHQRYLNSAGLTSLPTDASTAGLVNPNYMCRGNKFRHCSEASAAGQVCSEKTADVQAASDDFYGLCSGSGCVPRSSQEAKLRYIIPCRATAYMAVNETNDEHSKDAGCDTNYDATACDADTSCTWQLPTEYPDYSNSLNSAGLDFEEACIYPSRCDHSAIRCVMAHKSMAFNIFIWCQIFNEINARKVNGEHNTFEHFFQNPMYGIIIVITIVTQVILIEVFGASPGLQAVFKTTPATWDMWLVSLGIGAGSIIWNAMLNWIPPEYLFLGKEFDIQITLEEGTFAQDLLDTHVEVKTKTDKEAKTAKEGLEYT